MRGDKAFWKASGEMLNYRTTLGRETCGRLPLHIILGR